MHQSFDASDRALVGKASKSQLAPNTTSKDRISPVTIVSFFSEPLRSGYQFSRLWYWGRRSWNQKLELNHIRGLCSNRSNRNGNVHSFGFAPQSVNKANCRAVVINPLLCSMDFPVSPLVVRILSTSVGYRKVHHFLNSCVFAQHTCGTL